MVLGHDRVFTPRLRFVRFGRISDVSPTGRRVRCWLQAEVGPRRFYVRSWVNSGRRDVRYGPKSQANQNSTSSHLAECNITRFTLHSDGEVFRTALARSGMQIPPCCRDAAVPQGGLHEMYRGAPVERVVRMGVA